MPIYEYRCVEDGELIELIRPMADADKPVSDPAGKGRSFHRVHSTFALAGSLRDPGSKASSKPHTHSGGCACGNPHGPCN